MILTNKEEQRKIVLHRRNLLSPHEIREKSKTIREKVFEMQEFENAQNIFTYISFGSEVRTQEIIEKCIEIGKKVFVPAIDSENKKIVAAEFDGFKNLKKTVLGVMEPAKVKEFLPEKLELVLVPGIAFDEKLNRLGFGKGYFDEFLACIPAQVPTVALAFEAQIVASVPTTEKDVKVKKIVTEKRTIATQDLNISKSI